MKKRILIYLQIASWVLGSVGGFGCSLAIGAWYIAIAVAFTGWLAWPRIQELSNKLYPPINKK